MDRSKTPGRGHNHTNGVADRQRNLNDHSIGELLRQMSDDASHLVQQELALAKGEMHEALDNVRKAAVGFALAAIVALPGLMALTAFLVVVLANAIGSWAIATFVVGVVLMVIAGLMVQRGRSALASRNVTLPETRESLATDAEWGKRELRAFKEELTA